MDIKEVYKGELKEDFNIASLTSWKIGGICRYIAFPKSKVELIDLFSFITRNGIDYYIIGKGSNILFQDKYFNGIVIYLGKNFNDYTIQQKEDIFEIKALSGLTLNKLGKIARDNCLTGIEYLTYIPGTLGGALITNAEAHKTSIGDLVKEVTVLDNGIVTTLDRNECNFSYRSSSLGNKIVLEVVLELKKGDVNLIEEKMEEAKRFRIEKQPSKPSAGSVFKNPSIGPAGLLIDELGFKGKKVGGAIISNKHANFILNNDKATSKDVLELIEMIEVGVRNRYNLDLELEIKIFNN